MTVDDPTSIGRIARSTRNFEQSRRLPLEGEKTPTEFEREYVEILGESHRELYTFTMKLALWLTRGRRQDAEDRAHDVFVKLYRHQFDAPTSGRAWVTRTMRNRDIDLWRRRQTELKHSGERADYDEAMKQVSRQKDELPPDAIIVIRMELRRRLDAAIDQCPDERERAVFRAMVDYEHGLIRPTETIQSMTGLPAGAIRKIRPRFPALMRSFVEDLRDPDAPSQAI
ncbi:RNA polymerase sigma factor [Rhodococcus qingshengii]|uniref:RNA polymerase sigma factor n=1 Tax=Rhodococcus qingshengii TaxID=334542 RepID=UPI0022B436E3|nr:RNA polymerase sigma factor [Rhodococcus qingshengii]MCZ4618524.1 RNA polymerase sigma factor [Rhodococcus qingshengii]